MLHSFGFRLLHPHSKCYLGIYKIMESDSRCVLNVLRKSEKKHEHTDSYVIARHGTSVHFNTSHESAGSTLASLAAAAVVVVVITAVAAVSAVIRVFSHHGRARPRLCQQRQDLRLHKLPVSVPVAASAALQTQAAGQRVAHHQQVAQEVRHGVVPRVLAVVAQPVGTGGPACGLPRPPPPISSPQVTPRPPRRGRPARRLRSKTRRGGPLRHV